MKAVRLAEPWKVAVVNTPEPEEGDLAILKVHSAGICGSDIGAYRGANQLVTYPRIIGHEIAGEVIYVPANNPKGIKVGDRVVCDPYLYCGHCYPCSLGRTNCCDDLKVLGVHVDGGMSEYFAHPADMLILIPEGMSWEMAALAEPLTISLHGLHRAKLTAGEHIVISGAGPIGLLAALAAQSYGATPILSDPVDDRLRTAERLGVRYTVNPAKCDLPAEVKKICGGNLAEVVMEASGATPAIKSSFDLVRNAGRVIFTGWPKTDTDIPTGTITKKELDVRGARTSAGEFPEALDMINTGKIDMPSILTKVISIDEAPDTIIDIEKNPGNYIKVVVNM